LDKLPARLLGQVDYSEKLHLTTLSALVASLKFNPSIIEPNDLQHRIPYSPTVT